jgi:hypothetical protein
MLLGRHKCGLAAAVWLAVQPAFCADSKESSGPLESSPEKQLDWAKEREFWAFRAPVRHTLPKVRNLRWPSQPIDYFILAKLEGREMAPSVQADRRTLIRRVSFDLTGLPPTPEEITAFLNDARPEAYQSLVERLIASRAFGERMASMWLPLVRYAEDQAHQVGKDTKFFYPHAYQYRQWVIDAFNRDLPYDRFLQLQLAADKFADAPKKDLAALGLIGLGPKYYNRGRIGVMADEWEDRVDTVTRSMLGLTVACARCHDHKFEPITTHDYYALAGVFASTKMVNKTAEGVVDKNETPAEKMNPAALHIVEDGEAKDVNVFVRGDADRKGPVVERRFLRVLSQGEPRRFSDGSGRAELAEAIASETNPLTARVIVNRVWGEFFGKPIVATPSNFGHSGQPPVYPELLDDLAVRFMENGWSLKQLVRELVLSSTYRQTSREGPTLAADPSNEMLGRINRRRLSIEQWRDAVLFVSGGLDRSAGKSLELDDPENHRRTVYARVSRLKLNDLLMQFDYPDANVHAEKRSVTTTPVQKLFVLNSPFMVERSRALAARLTACDNKDAGRVSRAYQILFGRAPKTAEIELASEFLRTPNDDGLPAWAQYSQMLLASNEMFYID